MGSSSFGSSFIRNFHNSVSGLTPLGPGRHRAFRRNAKKILFRRHRQSIADTATLEAKSEKPVFGSITVMELLEKMRQVSDPTDSKLRGEHQLTHTLQALESLENASHADDDVRLAIMLHDLGKLLHLVSELPENVFGMKSPIGEQTPGIGLDQVQFQWNHDDFVYSRFKDRVSEPVSWLLRYHSIIIPECEKYMDAHDRAYSENYLREFQFHDQGSKSNCNPPRRGLEFYRQQIESTFPEPVMF